MYDTEIIGGGRRSECEYLICICDPVFRKKEKKELSRWDSGSFICGTLAVVIYLWYTCSGYRLLCNSAGWKKMQRTKRSRREKQWTAPYQSRRKRTAYYIRIFACGKGDDPRMRDSFYLSTPPVGIIQDADKQDILSWVQQQLLATQRSLNRTPNSV